MEELKYRLAAVHQEKGLLEKCLCKLQQKHYMLKKKEEKSPEDEEEINILRHECRSLKKAINELESCLHEAESSLIDQQSSHISQQEALRSYLHDMEGCLCSKVEEIKALSEENKRLRALAGKYPIMELLPSFLNKIF